MNVCVSFNKFNGLYAWDNDSGDKVEIPLQNNNISYLSNAFITACEHNSKMKMELGFYLENAIEDYYKKENK